mmetsp:Transcript_284/g.987  ORF Transcript_284/g.987 Transcript_284/m.987 type:complete len:477 (+) Transcript_284:81-1511(+)
MPEPQKSNWTGKAKPAEGSVRAFGGLSRERLAPRCAQRSEGSRGGGTAGGKVSGLGVATGRLEKTLTEAIAAQCPLACISRLGGPDAALEQDDGQALVIEQGGVDELRAVRGQVKIRDLRSQLRRQVLLSFDIEVGPLRECCEDHQLDLRHEHQKPYTLELQACVAQLGLDIAHATNHDHVVHAEEGGCGEHGRDLRQHLLSNGRSKEGVLGVVRQDGSDDVADRAEQTEQHVQVYALQAGVFERGLILRRRVAQEGRAEATKGEDCNVHEEPAHLDVAGVRGKLQGGDARPSFVVLAIGVLVWEEGAASHHRPDPHLSTHCHQDKHDRHPDDEHHHVQLPPEVPLERHAASAFGRGCLFEVFGDPGRVGLDNRIDMLSNYSSCDNAGDGSDQGKPAQPRGDRQLTNFFSLHSRDEVFILEVIRPFQPVIAEDLEEHDVPKCAGDKRTNANKQDRVPLQKPRQATEAVKAFLHHLP